MKLPYLTETPTSRTMIDIFGGYNHNPAIGENEFYETTNLTSSAYPTISPRQRRGIFAAPDKPLGMIEKDSPCYVDGKYFVIDGYHIDMELSDTRKSLISMGAYVIVMPDKKYIRTTPNEDGISYEHGDIEAYAESPVGATVTFGLCNYDGTAYGATSSNTPPENPQNMDYWIDTSSVPNILKQYSETSGMWVSVAATYIKITFDTDGAPFSEFSEGDGVTISGIKDARLRDLNATVIIWSKGDNYIVVTGIIDEETSQAIVTDGDKIKIERQMPNMDFIIEAGNRLWGCRYGQAQNGEFVNEIYASSLGDFKNWNCFAGISTDSYAATVGTDGEFTGAVTHLGYPIFFKENGFHKVYGSYPANFQIQATACRGVQRGCGDSLAIVNGVLFYKSRSGICAYDGSLPVEISSALGDIAYSDAVGGAVGNKYYISMKDAQNVYHLFVYDVKRGLWHREDNTQVKNFCACRGELYFIDAADDKIKTVLGSGVPEISPVNWSAVSGVMGTDYPDTKYVSRLDVRMSLCVGTRVYFFIEYDSSGKWQHLYTMTGTKLCSFALPLRLRRCDHFRLRIQGVGEAKIYSICKTIEKGSDIQ